MKVWTQKWFRRKDWIAFKERRSLHVEFRHPASFLKREQLKEFPYGEPRGGLLPVITMTGTPTEIEVTDPVILGELAFSEFGIWFDDWGPILEDED